MDKESRRRIISEFTALLDELAEHEEWPIIDVVVVGTGSGHNEVTVVRELVTSFDLTDKNTYARGSGNVNLHIWMWGPDNKPRTLLKETTER